MDGPLINIALCLGAAWAAGMAVGLERSFNGRAAGFRTHALVSLASAAVMAAVRLPSFRPELFAPGTLALDPTRMIQGLMTGVGFLGAGVIFKEGVSIQGLTTAASIWATAAFGALLGLGLWAPGLMAAAAVLATLTLLRTVEGRLTDKIYALGNFSFDAAQAPSESELRQMLGRHEVRFEDVSYSLGEAGRVLAYRGVLITRRSDGLGEIARRVTGVPGLVGFDMARISK